MKNQPTESLKPFESHPLIKTQFDYIEVSLVLYQNLYTVVYTYVKPNHETKTIEHSCMIETAMTGFTYLECATQVNNLLQMNFFKVPVMALGVIYDKSLNQIGEINWNQIMASESTDQEPSKTIH